MQERFSQKSEPNEVDKLITNALDDQNYRRPFHHPLPNSHETFKQLRLATRFESYLFRMKGMLKTLFPPK